VVEDARGQLEDGQLPQQERGQGRSFQAGMGLPHPAGGCGMGQQEPRQGVRGENAPNGAG
jgi:hypothetical protein